MARLIDADALIIEWNKLAKHMVKDGDGKIPVDFGIVICELSKTPTVDAVPVVHGRWEFHHTTTVEKYDVVKCSNCGHEAFAIAIYVKEGHYCPNCGAKMDLE